MKIWERKVRDILNALLDKYAEKDIKNIKDLGVLRVKPLRDIGTPIEIINLFESIDNFLEAVGEMETQLYVAED